MKSRISNRIPQEPFRTATWNMYAATPIETSAPALDAVIDWGVDLIFGQEASGRNRDRLFESRGFETAALRQYRLAWNPRRFKLLKQWDAKLSEQMYFKKDGKTPVYSSGQAVLLEDLKTGLTLEAWCYHTPAHIQVPEDERPARRYEALVESMRFLADRAENTNADGFICAGDDNWDEDGPNEDGGLQTSDVASVLLGEETGLRQVQANEPTFSTREIDDYRIRFLKLGGSVKPTGELLVIPGLGAEKPAHKIHMREWRMLVAAPKPVEHACPDCREHVVHTGVLI